MTEEYIKTLNQDSIHQSNEWGLFQRSVSREIFQVNKLLISKIPLGFGLSWFWIPRPEINSTELEKLWPEIQKLAKQEKIVYLRLENSNLELKTKDFKLITAHQSYLPENTLILDLKKDEETLLKEMKSKGRYNIRLAAKNLIEIESYDYQSDNLELAVSRFYKLLKQTTSRDGFSGHQQEYYFKFIKNLEKKAKLYLAKYDGKYIAGTINTFSKNVCTYYYGASGNQHRNLMAPYLLQWEAIKEAKSLGCQLYDFLGIAKTNNEGKYDKTDSLSSVTEFKLKFGGESVSYPASQEFVFKKAWYLLMRLRKLL